MSFRTYMFCFIIFATFEVIQAKSVSLKITVKKSEPNRNVINKPKNLKLNKYVHPDKSTNNCVENNGEIFCVIFRDTGDVYRLKKHVTKHSKDKSIEKTRLKHNLRFLTGISGSNTRDDKFSEDYLDIGDLSASRKEADVDKSNIYSKLKLIISSFQSSRGLTPKLGSRKMNVADLINLIDFRSHDSDTSEEATEIYRKIMKPKRFEVVENSDENEQSEEPSNDLSIPVRYNNLKPKIFYVQGPTRHLPLEERRSRMPHFMPKRYHWSLDDIEHLPYFWFNGPQGYFAGVYKVFI